MEKNIRIKLSENKKLMENLHKAEINKLKSKFDTKINEL